MSNHFQASKSFLHQDTQFSGLQQVNIKRLNYVLSNLTNVAPLHENLNQIPAYEFIRRLKISNSMVDVADEEESSSAGPNEDAFEEVPSFGGTFWKIPNSCFRYSYSPKKFNRCSEDPCVVSFGMEAISYVQK